MELNSRISDLQLRHRIFAEEAQENADLLTERIYDLESQLNTSVKQDRSVQCVSMDWGQPPPPIRTAVNRSFYSSILQPTLSHKTDQTTPAIKEGEQMIHAAKCI